MTDATLIGIDCATDPRKVGLALAKCARGVTTLLDVRLGSPAALPEDVVAGWIAAHAGPVLLALDAPLGWPAPLGAALVTHHAGAPLDADAHMLFRRETDRFVKRVLGKQSLDVGADRIARTAHAALGLIDRVGTALHQTVPRAWTPHGVGVRAIEVYPAATLRAYGLDAAGYKQADNVAARARLVDALGAHFTIEVSRDVLAATDHAIDAAVCVLAGHDFLSGTAMPPENPGLATVEGWIWVRLNQS